MKPRLIAITDPAFDEARVLWAVKAIARALPRGTFAVQVRNKAGISPSFALRLHEHVPVIVNGDASLAARFDGLHLPAAAPRARHAWTSWAAHTDDDVTRARGQATAILVSPIFDTPGKGSGRGTEALVRARAIAGQALVVYALGGITEHNVAACAAAGADGVAVIRALWQAEDPVRVATALVSPFGLERAEAPCLP